MPKTLNISKNWREKVTVATGLLYSNFCSLGKGKLQKEIITSIRQDPLTFGSSEVAEHLVSLQGQMVSCPASQTVA